MKTRTHLNRSFRDGRKHQAVFLLFCLSIALLGGASRADETALALLRPIAILCAGIVLWLGPIVELKKGRALIVALTALCLLGLLQLTPLPPSIWTSLPGREVIANVDQLIFEEMPWRPITLSPSGTWNALFYTISLLAGILVFLSLRSTHYPFVKQLLLAIIVASVLISFFQESGNNFLPVYNMTSPGATGLLSNSNHFGILSAIGILVAADLTVSKRTGVSGYSSRWILFGVFTIFLLAGSFLSGSRLGFSAAILAIACAAMLFLRDARIIDAMVKRANAQNPRHMKRLLSAGLVILGAVAAYLFADFALTQRAEGLGNFQEPSMSEDLRWRIFPELISLAREQFPWGAGLGSFAEFYAIFEPQDDVRNQYVNNAHNDFIQLVIEGGVIAVCILVAMMVWLSVRTMTLFHAKNIDRGLLVLTLLGIVFLASAFDYVLRTPLIAWIVACLIIMWLSPSENFETGKGSEPR